MPGPQLFDDGQVIVHHGDCLEHLRGMPEGSVDAVVTDPPYALAFMGREWDRQPSPKAFEAWCEQWAAECLRVVKPGGYLASFGGTRTYHRLACGVEDAGWYVTDAIGAGLYAWTHGQGFPKGKSQLKPAWEPITIARKPAAKVQPLGIDVCRIPGQVPVVPQSQFGGSNNNIRTAGRSGDMSVAHDAGRWPTNLLLAHHPECVEVGTREVRSNTPATWRGGTAGTDGFTAYGAGVGTAKPGATRGAYGTNGRETVAAFDCHQDCHVAALDEQSGTLKSGDLKPYASASGKSGGIMGETVNRDHDYTRAGDSCGASRFYPTFRYTAKAGKRERPQAWGQHPDCACELEFPLLPESGELPAHWGPETVCVVCERPATFRGHPTVKPLSLMSWLVRLVCPPGGIVLDPFAGSGTTLQAARDEGMRAVGIEADEHSVQLIAQRLAAHVADAEHDLFTTSAS